MRLIALFAAALLLSGCTRIREEMAPAPPVVAPAVRPGAKPASRPHVERPAPVTAAPAPAPVIAPPAVTPPDYSARCHAMAQNRADDAKELGGPGGGPD
ncbi:MAG: hypothetical protein WDN08_15235 [Rhizomicrobium sp.]